MDKDLKLVLHEKVITKLFSRKKELVIFDIGACEGLSSLRYLSIFPKSVVYAFEPVPNNFKKILEKKIKVIKI